MFLTFEGGEGCGKSTQSRLLLQELCRRGIPAILTREPGGTVLGDKIRKILKIEQGMRIPPQTELFLFAASRAQLVTEVIRPALTEGKVVICDRFVHSTVAYQSCGRGLSQDMVEQINRQATQNLEPDLTVFLDMPSEQGLARKKQNPKDRFEKEDLFFHRRVRKGYLEMAAANPSRWLVVDAAGLSEERVFAVIREKIDSLLCPV